DGRMEDHPVHGAPAPRRAHHHPHRVVRGRGGRRRQQGQAVLQHHAAAPLPHPGGRPDLQDARLAPGVRHLPGRARQPPLLDGELHAAPAHRPAQHGHVVGGVGRDLRGDRRLRRHLHPHPGPEEPRMTRAARRVIGRVLFYLLVAAIFVYLMFPFYWAIVSALKTQAELIRTPATLWPQNPVLDNFKAVLSNRTFTRALLKSTIVASSVTLLTLVVGSFAGYALGKMRFRGKTPSLYVILAMTMFPQIAVLAGLYAVIRVLGMPSIPSIILSYMLFTLPFTVWVLT